MGRRGGGEPVVPVLAGQASAVALSVDPEELVAGYNNVSHLRVDVRDRFGNPVSDGTPVAFRVSLGSGGRNGDHIRGGGEGRLYRQVGRRVQRNHCNGGGRCPRFRSIGDPSRATRTNDPQRQPNTCPTGGLVELAAAVQDQYGNSVPNGTIVDFHSSSGQLTSASVPVADGVALTRLEAPATPGRLDLVAHCGSASASTSAFVDVLRFIYLPLVQQ